MKVNRWKKNFNRSAVVDLYVKPIISAAVIFIAVIGVLRWVAGAMVDPTAVVLAILLYYAFYLDAKLDMLKRTLDSSARFRDTRKLWVEGELE